MSRSQTETELRLQFFASHCTCRSGDSLSTSGPESQNDRGSIGSADRSDNWTGSPTEHLINSPVSQFLQDLQMVPGTGIDPRYQAAIIATGGTKNSSGTLGGTSRYLDGYRASCCTYTRARPRACAWSRLVRFALRKTVTLVII
jgi:hypothetical protein